MTIKQKAVIVGSILGDGFLQKTGKSNARLRLEHSYKQQSYLLWKYKVLKDFFPNEPKFLERTNSKFNNTYQYIRAQTYSGIELGKLADLFYNNRTKVVPEDIESLLRNPLSLAIWFMDDGYYYPRDRIGYIYLPKYDQLSLQNLLQALSSNFSLFPILKIKKRGEYVFNFSVKETQKLIKLIKPFIIPAMEYKIGLKLLPFDPVSTEPIKRGNDISLGRDVR